MPAPAIERGAYLEQVIMDAKILELQTKRATKQENRQQVDDHIANCSAILALIAKDDNYESIGLEQAVRTLETAHQELTKALAGARSFQERYDEF